MQTAVRPPRFMTRTQTFALDSETSRLSGFVSVQDRLSFASDSETSRLSGPVSIQDRLSFSEGTGTAFLSPERKVVPASSSPISSSPVSVPENAKPFFLPGGEHAVLLLHGFTGSPSHMRPLGDALNAAGFTVRGIALKGHDETVRDMMRATWHDWLEDARRACAELALKYARVSVAGLSMGGVLALLLAEEYANNAERALTACVPIEAPMDTTNHFRHLSLLAAPFIPVMNKRADGSRDTLDKAYDCGY